jgi:O-antigen/teichoic acid export membrane protein
MWTSASFLMPYVCTTIISIVAARILGPDDMGRQSFIAFVVLTGQTAVASGIGYSLARHAGELIGRGQEGAITSLVRLGWRLVVPMGILAAGALVIVALVGAEPQAAWVFAAIAVLAGVLNNVPVRILVGVHRWREQSIVLIVVAVASVVPTILVLVLGGGVNGMLAVTAVSALVMFTWCAVLMRRAVRMLAGPQLELGTMKNEVIRFALASTVPVILTFVVLQRSEFFILDIFSDDSQIALYSIAYSSLAALLALPMAVRAVVLPSVATLVGAGEFDRIRRGFSRLVRLTILLTVPLTAAGLALGPRLLELVYGDQYEGAGKVLLILVAPLPLVPLSAAGSAVLMGFGRIRLPTLVAALAATVDIGAALLLVPRLDAVGAAIANVLAALAATIPLIPYCARLLGGIDVSLRDTARVVLVSAAAACAAALVLQLGTSGLNLAVATVAGVASFMVLAPSVRMIPAADAEWLAQVARERGAHPVERVLYLLATGRPAGGPVAR